MKIDGRRMLYCITLRPLFFRRSRPTDRVTTILHELFHISTGFDGTLDANRRHAKMGAKFEKKFRPLRKALIASLPSDVLAPFASDGDVRVQQWLERPSGWLPGEKASSRRGYTEAHLFTGIVRMKTRGAAVEKTHEKSGALH